MLEEFLTAAFTGLGDDEAIIVQRQMWSDPVEFKPSYAGLNLFNISTLCRGTERRTYGNCIRQHVVVFDDIGTKAKPCGVEPHWILETSVGNYQHGFFIVPQKCTPSWRATFNGFIKQAADAGLTDSGAISPNRLVRLPHSRKNTCEFEAQLTQWRPAYDRWKFQDLVHAVGVTYQPKRVKPKPAISMECAHGDVVVQWFVANGIDPVPHEDTIAVFFPCPFPHASGVTGSRDAAYWPSDRRFSCFHATCLDRKEDLQRMFRQWLWDKGGPDIR